MCEVKVVSHKGSFMLHPNKATELRITHFNNLFHTIM